MAKCSVCESEGFDSDLDDFSIEEILDHLEWEADSMTQSELNKLKKIAKDTDETFAEQVLAENTLYQKIISLGSAEDVWKMEVIIENLRKFTYTEICQIFEN